MQRKEMEPNLVALAIDIYKSKIDGWTTKMVAAEYGVSQAKALKNLMAIAKGEIYAPQYPFGDYCNNMCGVEIADGSTFTYGDNADFAEGKRRNNQYNWFTH
jgi:hypothetical protein